MFRAYMNQNLKSLCRPLQSLVRKRLNRYLSDSPKKPPRVPSKIKITICGANGQLGSILSFLLKQSPLVDILSLYDLDSTYGMAMDLSHIDTKCRVQSFSGCEDLSDCLEESKIIIICAGVGRNPGMSLNDLFEYNAPVVKQLAETISEVNPEALVAILTNPLNSFVPMVSQIFKYASCYDPRKIFGITNIDTMRACTIVARDILQDEGDPAEFLVPVIGGHSPETMVPVISQTCPCVEIPNVAFEYLIDKIKNAANLVTTIKHHGGPRLSVALAAARFINNLIRGLKFEKGIVDVAYVHTNVVPGVSYFAAPIELGPFGVKNHLGLLKLDEELEKHYLKEAIKYLKCEIKRGENYIPAPTFCD